MRRVLAVSFAAVVLLTACGEDAPDKVSLYDRAPVPAVPNRTMAVEGGLADGQYWATDVEAVAGGSLQFVLRQAFFADACVAALGEDQCDNDFGVADEPQRSLTVPVDDIVSATVVAADRQNYAVTGAELLNLVSSGPPSPPAPSTYKYVPYPFLVTVQHGTVIEVEQIWVP